MSLAALHDYQVRDRRDQGCPLAQAELIKRGLAQAPRDLPIQAPIYAKSYKEDHYIQRRFQR